MIVDLNTPCTVYWRPAVVSSTARKIECTHGAECTPIKAELLVRSETIAWHAGIIGGLMAYIIINGANFLLDKVAECMHWSIAGSDTQPLSAGSGSFISRLQSNTGGAAQVSKFPASPFCSLWCGSTVQGICMPVASSGSHLC